MGRSEQTLSLFVVFGGNIERFESYGSHVYIYIYISTGKWYDVPTDNVLIVLNKIYLRQEVQRWDILRGGVEVWVLVVVCDERWLS